ncbi:hypothetical protein R7035_18860 [Vibrio sp. 1731]|uniref:hypothetical protein n=1 Tax=Vibrio TaxID=662 RepID=UPI00215D1102|nr:MULTISPECIES: hypothetical protein [Vibrio]MCR9638647.1 hypothetical protein [Vibrio alginolyticus]MDW2115578.1 hypothetical protein [Vibrio sp. 1731]
MKSTTLALSYLAIVTALTGCNSSSEKNTDKDVTHKPAAKNVFISECSTTVTGMTPLQFEVQGKTAIIDGVSCDGSTSAFNNMLSKNPSVNQLYLRDISGSIDDDANLKLGRLIRSKKMKTVVDSNSHVTSGGVDLYLAGASRSWSAGAKLGVHSWSDGVKDGREYPSSHSSHDIFTSYYQDMGINSDFYWFTLNSAKSSSMHYLTLDEIVKYEIVTEESSFLGITTVPKELAKTYSLQLGFDRYTEVKTPNGKRIPILAQDELTDEQIIRARNVLSHYLTNFDGSEYGDNKSEIANKMAENNAKLLLLNGKDDGSNPAAKLDGQPLYKEEIQVEGGSWYIEQNYEHRDATFEEILHLVHDYGIGVDQNEKFLGALPGYQAELRSAQVNALTGKIWGLGEDNQAWIQELTKENSLSQEYYAAVVDSYYGLWGAWGQKEIASVSIEGSADVADTETSTLTDLLDATELALLEERRKHLEEKFKGGMWGIYTAKTRAEMSTLDPLGLKAVQKLLHPYLTYNARVSKSFEGTFSLKFDTKLPYTHHSQYLKNITLTGSNNVNVIVNKLGNKIVGNKGKNTVIFSGDESNYTITKLRDGKYSISDNRDNGDGVVLLENIEKIKFSSSERDL